MALIIFAKFGTSEKAAVNSGLGVIYARELLTKTFGGDWVFVDKCEALDCVHFDDGEVYKGFEVDKERYSPFIKKLEAC